MKAKKICAGAMALVLSMGTMSAFTGCGSSTDSSSKAVTPEVSQADIKDSFDAKGAKLEVLTNRTDRKEDGKLDALTDKFEEAYNCTVEYTAYKDYDTDVATRMGTDDYGDVLCIPSSLKLEELPTYFVSIGTYDEFKDTYRWSDKKMTADGNVYGLAVGGTATGVLYNKKIWEQAGITETPKTPDEFLADLQLIKDNTDAIPYYTNFKDASWTIGQWQNLVLSAAGGAEAENKLLQDKSDLFVEGNGYYEPTFFGVDGMDGILTLEGFDTSLAEGVMLLTPFNADATDEKTQSFVTKYQELYGDVPNQFAADAYDCVYAYKAALEASGATADMSAEELCDKMIEAFPTLTYDGLTGTGITWDSTGAVSKTPKGMVIKNGAYVGME